MVDPVIAHLKLLDELNNALAAHQSLYSGNPAGWDPESAWGALQRITAELCMAYMRDVGALPRIMCPPAQFYAVKCCDWYVRYCIDHPLVRSGYTTQHDAEAFAKRLVALVTALVRMGRGTDPAKLTKEYERLIRG